MVGLHHSVYAVDALEEEGEHRDVMLLCEQGVGFVELFDVVGAIVRREGDSGKRNLDVACLKRGDDFVEVGAGVLDGEAA